MKCLYKFLPTVFALLFYLDLSGQILNLGPDTSYCTNDSFLITSNLIDSTYSYFWSTGDTTSSINVDTSGVYWLQITYDTLRMNDTIRDTIIISDTIILTLNNVPIPDFSTLSACYNNPSLIFNNSIFEPNSAITYIIGPDTIQNSSDTFAYSLLSNGGSSIVFASIVQLNGCFAGDTFTISSLLKPDILLANESTCKNVNPIITDSSTNTTPSYMISITENETLVFPESDFYQLPLQSPGTHVFSCILNNNNGCSDSTQLPLYIFDIFPREIIGLETHYCVGDPPDQILGNFPGGDITGEYIINMSPGQAEFNPAVVDSNIAINYTYTDSNNCTLDTTSIVEHIFALPQLGLSGLDGQYCQFDPSSIISVSPPGGILSGDMLTEITTSSAVFTPTMLVSNELMYIYTDINTECSSSIIKYTIVNPLPNVELGPSDTLLTSGDTLILGPEFIEPNIIYDWSTGQTGQNENIIEITNPGYYILTGTNSVTTCTASDTILVELANKINEISLSKDFKLYPNPFKTELTVESKQPIVSIKLFDLTGQRISIDVETDGQVTKLKTGPSGMKTLLLQINNYAPITIIRLEGY